MAHRMSVTFLGTSSGGGPVDTRSCSSQALDIVGNGSLWLVDCAEGTLRQFAMQPNRLFEKRLKANRITKIFITHMHFDHTMGLITLLANILRGAAGTPQPPRTTPPLIELYGPAGLREFLRSILKMTKTELTERYTVHELLTSEDAATSCQPEELHMGECPGKDFVCSEDGLWMDFTSERNIIVSAGPLLHRVPCIGYVFRELAEHGRKLVILGDTCDPSALTDIAQNASLLVHEATDAHIPASVDRALRGDSKTPQSVLDKTIAKGHSTPAMAGQFAKKINAQRLALNHFSGRFPAPGHRQDRRQAVMSEIERQASEAWEMGSAIASFDYLRIEIPSNLEREPMADSHRHRATTFDVAPISERGGHRGFARGGRVHRGGFTKRRKTVDGGQAHIHSDDD